MARFLRLAVLLAVALASGAQAQSKLVDVVEFYNATLDHHFISSLAPDIAALDSGKLVGWSRTGLGFKAWDGPTAGMSPVCRFYIPPANGDSHFYSASPAECAEVAQKFPSFSYESPSVMYVGLPDPASGACAAGTIAVYRLWNKRADTNHRYTTDLAIRSAMIAKGYVPEGYGPDGVAMCAIGGTEHFEVSIAPASVLLLPGETSDVYVTVTPLNGFTGTVSLSAVGLPGGVTQQFAATALTVGAKPVSTNVRVTASASAPVTADLAQIEVTVSEGSAFSATRTLGVAVVAATDPVATRLRTIAAVEIRAQQLRAQGLTKLPLVQAIATYMATLPAYAESGVDEETIGAWARFNDGTMHVFTANRDPAPAAALQRPLPQAREGAVLPGRARAKLLHSFGRNFQNQAAIEQMRAYLVATGWVVDGGAEGNASVETIKSVVDHGFFYINSHSFRLGKSDPNEPEGRLFGVQTSTIANLGFDRVYAAELATLQLVHQSAENGDEVAAPDGGVTRVVDTRYGFTYRFVDRFMSFPEGSVVFINGCFSIRNQSFVDAFHRKGAAVVFGWTEVVTGAAADKAPPYLVDRLLGANQHPDKESPPQRAFPYDLVLANMATKGLDFDATYNARLAAQPKPGIPYPPILAPSIRMVAIDEIGELLTLYGYFGSDPRAGSTGIVTVGGKTLDIENWAPGKIVAKLPRTGAGANGDVIVVARGVKSNARQITEWPVGVELTETVPQFGATGSFTYQGTGTFRFRGDIAGWRTAPGDVVKYVQRGGMATQDSKINVSGSGTTNLAGCTSTLSGTADYVSITSNNGLATSIPVTKALFGVNADTKAAAFGFLLAGEQAPHTITVCSGATVKSLASMGPLKATLTLPTQQDDFANPTGIPGFQFTLNGAYGMPAQSDSKSGLSFIGNITVTTKAAAAISPPRDTDDSGK